MNRKWSVAEAKAKFSEVIDLAQSHGPQTVTRNGRTAVVIVAAEEWERKSRRRGNLAEFFAASPLRGSQLDVKRFRDRPCKVDPLSCLLIGLRSIDQSHINPCTTEVG
jgi:prevent-host-death family protein